MWWHDGVEGRWQIELGAPGHDSSLRLHVEGEEAKGILADGDLGWWVASSVEAGLRR
jgi:hypothetical protein